MSKKVLPPIIPHITNKVRVVHGCCVRVHRAGSLAHTVACTGFAQLDADNFDAVNVDANKITPYTDDGSGWDKGF